MNLIKKIITSNYKIQNVSIDSANVIQIFFTVGKAMNICLQFYKKDNAKLA